MRRSAAMRTLILAALLATPILATPALATSDDLRSVAGMEGRARVLLTFSPTLGDRRLKAQRATMAHFGVGAAERDVVFVQVSQGQVLGAHDRDDKLRRKFDTPAPRYRTLLIGKDGKVALDLDRPIDEATLARAIDAMPMRRAEVARARAGMGKTTQ